MYNRTISHRIQEVIFTGKAIIILGPRQVGKTTLMQSLIAGVDTAEYLMFSGDYPGDRRELQFDNRREMDHLIGDAKWILIDEGQKIPNIGDIIKAIVDTYGSEKQVIVTGSSSIGLLDYTAEPLTGRKYVFHLFPIAFSEIVSTASLRSARQDLEHYLLYGMYPDILSTPGEKQKVLRLREIIAGQLYRDILEFQQVKNSDTIVRLLELLALQIGQEVSYHKIAQVLGISQNTVERYVDLLEKSFIVFRLRPYATNKKKEITKMKKIYFYDLGIRNGLLGSFAPLELRNDVGHLFENFFVAERQKSIAYNELIVDGYFWRTNNQEEVDYIEATSIIERAYECKWKTQKYTPPKAFTNTYPGISVELVDQDNFHMYL